MANILDQSKSKLSTKKSCDLKGSASQNPWDVAIAEAEQRIKDFKFSIKVFRKMKAKGAPWRGLESGASEA